MSPLFSLPNETLFAIIAQMVAEPHSSGKHANRQLWSLSRTCKFLNTCCAHWLFKKYHLRIRANFCFDVHLDLTPLDNPDIPKNWNTEAVMARLRHLKLKAPYVQELIIEDYVSHPCQPGLFPEIAVQELLNTLKEAEKLNSVHFVAGSEGELPLSLWDWLISKKRLEKLSVKGLLSPPDHAQGHLSVGKFKAELSWRTTKVLKLVRPHTIFLSYNCSHHKTPQFDPYKPSGAENSQIRHVEVDILLPRCFETPLFDFSGIPDADIIARFTLGAGYNMQILDAWRNEKRKLLVVFAEGIHGYNVSRCVSEGSTTVSRPNLAKINADWKPSQAAHLEGEEEEMKLDENNRKYYAFKYRHFNREEE